MFESKNDTEHRTNLKKSIMLSADGIDNKSIKMTQAAFFRFPNKYTRKGIENISKMIILPFKYGNIETENNNYYKLEGEIASSHIAFSNDSNYLLLFMPMKENDSTTLLYLFDRMSKKLIKKDTFKENIKLINYSSNSNYIALITAKNIIYICDSLLNRINVLNSDPKIEVKSNSKTAFRNISFGSEGDHVSAWQRFLISKGFDIEDEEGKFEKTTQKATIQFQNKNQLSADGVVGNRTFSKAVDLGFNYSTPLQTITGISFQTKKNSSNILSAQILVNFQGNSLFLNFKNIKSKEFIDTLFDHQSVFSNPDLIYYFDDDFLKEYFDYVDENGKIKQEKNVYRNLTYYDAILLQKESKNIVDLRFKSLDDKIGFYEELNSENPYLDNNSVSKILGIDKKIIFKFFSPDNRFFSITDDGVLSEWDFEASQKIDTNELIIGKSPFEFNILDSINFEITSFEDAAEQTQKSNVSIEFLTGLLNLSENSVNEKHTPSSLQAERRRAQIYSQMYEIEKTEDRKNELALSFIDLSDELIFNGLFKEGLNTALLSVKLDTADNYGFANVALGYLLTNNKDSGQYYYNKYMEELCFVFLQDLNKVINENVLKEGDPLISEVEKMIKMLNECKKR